MLSKTFKSMENWDGKELPPEDVFASFISDYQILIDKKEHGKLAQRLKKEKNGFNSILKKLKSSSEDLHRSITNENRNIEKISKKLRRSIFAKKNIKKNDKLTKDNIETIRPFVGICASEYFDVIGKKVKKNIAKGSAIRKNILLS